MTARRRAARTRIAPAALAAALTLAACGGGQGGGGSDTPTAAAPPRAPLSALARSGAGLFSTNCASCHSVTGSGGIGPSLDGIAGKEVTLASGTKVKATDAYLRRSLLEPDADITRGYVPGLMAQNTRGLDLAADPQSVRALIAYLHALD